MVREFVTEYIVTVVALLAPDQIRLFQKLEGREKSSQIGMKNWEVTLK